MSQVFGAWQTVFLLGEFLHWVPAALLTSLGFVVCGFRRSSCAPDAPQFVHLAGANALDEDVSTRVTDWGKQSIESCTG